MSAWAPSGSERFGLVDGGAASAATLGTALAGLATPAQAYANEAKQWHPSSPMFAFGVVAALTFGFMAVSTSGGASVRLGKTVASVTGGGGIGTAK